MANIWEDDFKPEGPAPTTKRLSAAPDAVAALIAALHAELRTTNQLIELQLEPRSGHTRNARALYLTGSDATTGMPVFAKLNTSPWETHWMLALTKQAPDLVPHVLAGGKQLGAYALHWLVLEKTPYQLGAAWGDQMFEMLAEAAVRFQMAAQLIDRRFTGIEGLDSTQRWIELGLREGCPGPLDRVLQRLEYDWEWVTTRCSLEVCFGDLTPVNALSRTPPPGRSHALLIDPIPRVAHWPWDAAYCQVIASHSDVRMIQRMAEIRRQRGLHALEGAELDQLATIMLAWLSALWWGIAPWQRDDTPWREQIQRYVEQAALL